jgi:hypothetical protein
VPSGRAANALTPQFVLLTTGVGAPMILFGLGRGLLRAPQRQPPLSVMPRPRLRSLQRPRPLMSRGYADDGNRCRGTPLRGKKRDFCALFAADGLRQFDTYLARWAALDDYLAQRRSAPRQAQRA